MLKPLVALPLLALPGLPAAADICGFNTYEDMIGEWDVAVGENWLTGEGVTTHSTHMDIFYDMTFFLLDESLVGVVEAEGATIELDFEGSFVDWNISPDEAGNMPMIDMDDLEVFTGCDPNDLTRIIGTGSQQGAEFTVYLFMLNPDLMYGFSQVVTPAYELKQTWVLNRE